MKLLTEDIKPLEIKRQRCWHSDCPSELRSSHGIDCHHYGILVSDAVYFATQDVSKMLSTDLRGELFTRKRNKNIHTKVYPTVSVYLNLTGRLASTITSLNMKCCTYSWSNTFTTHLPSLITVGFLLCTKLHFTKNVRNVLHLSECTHGCFWSQNLGPFQRS